MEHQLTHRLNGEIALVTGGGTGLGRAIAISLADAGAKVCIAGRRREPLAAVVEAIGEDRCCAVCGDVTKAEDRAAMIAAARDTFANPISILVNNAGINIKKPALEVEDALFQQVMEIHVNAAFALSRDVAPSMLKNRRGSILFLASMASYMGVPQIVSYTAAKCAVVGLTRALAAEWSADGVRVNAVAPGWIESPMTSKALDSDPQRKQKVFSRTPMGSMGKPNDIGRAIVFLCSADAGFITGQVLPVDGGASIGF
ncbi:SDR family NAD(P)-dependent oxidoreductase [Novipirellula artificiosorum]|uniref:3-oxoacyl-[acyl-carrier-protein] reductase FabG n=1 Tax=Novipirellula artificiosorum TaxID=2528016 RepID=A0A5C6DKT1_9BACT|nr:SDR family oxidoreductase [Novipirellula artificiosorum]TWU37378.1 3-oxoacyl-[acyl-carrier-protein] reductase FabG [Novipirellula artificiosorum]